MFKNKCILRYLTFSLLLIITSSYGQSQESNLHYKVDINISGRIISGTFNQIVTNGSFNGELLFKNWQLENKTTYRYNKTNTRLIEDNWHELATLKYYPNGKRKVYPGVFYHFDNNLMFRVNSRHQYGIGAGSELEKGSLKLTLLTAIAKERSTYNGNIFENSELDFPIRNNGLFLFRLDTRIAISKKINISNRLFYFQSLKESVDYDIWMTTRLNYILFKNLSTQVVYDYRFENVHLESLSNYNAITLFGLTWTLGSDN